MKKKLNTIITTLVLSSGLHPNLHAAEPSDSVRFNSLAEQIMQKNIPNHLHMDLILRTSLNGTVISRQNEQPSGAFRFDHIMIGLHGNITEHLSYTFRYRLSKDFRIQQTENISNSIDIASLSYQFTPQYKLIAGRQTMLIGGFEYNEHPVNVYESSGINYNQPCYLTGLTFSFTPKTTQEIAVQAVNNRTGSPEETYGIIPDGMKNSRLPLYYSVSWNGKFLNEKIIFRYAASTGEQMQGKWMVLIGGGQQLVWDKFSVYLDALYCRSAIDHMSLIRNYYVGQENTNWNGIVKHVDFLSVVSEASYRLNPKWNIKLKGYYDRASIFKENINFPSGTYLSAWNIQGAIEFYPMKDDNMHIYLNSSNKFHKNVQGKPVMNQPNIFRLSLGLIYSLPVF